MRIDTRALVAAVEADLFFKFRFSTFLPTVFPGYMGLSSLLDGTLARRIASDFSDHYPLVASAHHLLHSFERSPSRSYTEVGEREISWSLAT